jgi:ParB family chromosome partitioning protein
MTKRLGRGLADLIDAPNGSEAGNYVMLKTDRIKTGRFQPREAIPEDGLEELKASIKRSGIIEPIIVRPIAHDTYELVAGERRLRASQALGLGEIPAVIKPLSDQQALEHSIVENIQREALNPLEQAKGFQRLLEEFGYTQEAIAASVGKDRTTVANILRLLTLPEEIREALGRGTMTMGHAKALLSLTDRARQLQAYHQVTRDGLSVRQTERLVGSAGARRLRGRVRSGDPHVSALEDALRRAFGTKVRIISRKQGGRVVIEYFSPEDLSRILQVAGVGDGPRAPEPLQATAIPHG